MKTVIDFDAASSAWRENKKHLSNGIFRYICGHPTKSGGKCQLKPKGENIYCYRHCKDNISQ